MSSRKPKTPVSARKTAKTRIAEFGSKFLVAVGKSYFANFVTVKSIFLANLR